MITLVAAGLALLAGSPQSSVQASGGGGAGPAQQVGQSLRGAGDFAEDLKRLRATRDKAEAVKLTDELVRNYPSHADAHGWAGIMYSWAHHRVRALESYNRAIELDADEIRYLNRSLTRPKSDLAGRKADVEAAAALDPTLGAIWSERARIASAEGDYASAIADLTLAIEKSPEDESMFIERGIAHIRLGNLEKAKQDFAAAKERLVEPWDRGAWCRFKGNAGIELLSALEDCTDFLAVYPQSPPTLVARGFVLLRLGRLDEAMRDYDHVLRLEPNHPSALMGRAIVWARKGNAARSKADRAAALGVDPYIQDDFATYGVFL